MIKNLNYYMKLDYNIITRELTKEEGGGYLAYYELYDGVIADGESEEEAINEVK